MTRRWWHDKKLQKRPGIRALLIVFRVQDAEMIELARPFHRYESRATRPGHFHRHRPAGSKMLKRTNRQLWEQRRQAESAARA